MHKGKKRIEEPAQLSPQALLQQAKTTQRALHYSQRDLIIESGSYARLQDKQQILTIPITVPAYNALMGEYNLLISQLTDYEEQL